MPRIRRVAPAGLAHHVLNRGNNRACIFRKPRDYQAFAALLLEAQDRVPMRVLAWALMPNHFHLVLWPETMDAISAYMRWLMNGHIRRYQHHYGTCGHGHVYQGRFKNFPIQTGGHLLRVLRYVEANALRAGLVARAEDWPWSSLAPPSDGRPLLTPSPVPRPPDWLDYVNAVTATQELGALRSAVRRGAPFGESAWSERVTSESGLQFTVRPQGHPPGGSPARGSLGGTRVASVRPIAGVSAGLPTKSTT